MQKYYVLKILSYAECLRTLCGFSRYFYVDLDMQKMRLVTNEKSGHGLFNFAQIVIKLIRADFTVINDFVKDSIRFLFLLAITFASNYNLGYGSSCKMLEKNICCYIFF